MGDDVPDLMGALRASVGLLSDRCPATLTIPGEEAGAAPGNTAQCIWYQDDDHPMKHRGEFVRFDVLWEVSDD